MKVAIVKYNAGNVFSVQCAMKRIGIEPVLTDDFETLQSADKIIFPGVGEASTAMEYLKAKGLDAVIKDLKQPVLGICIGLQLLCKNSEEGNAQGLGVFDIDVKRFQNQGNRELKIPHMGWNTISIKDNELIPAPISNQFVYFVHSYYAPVCKHTIATCNYITEFSAALHKDNFYATQFHPEKSGSVGEKVLKQFIDNI